MKKKSNLLIVILVVVLFVCGCQRSQPEDTIYKLEEAMNSYDMEKMLECYEPSVQKIYAGAMEVGSAVAGVDLDTLVNAAGGVADLFGDELMEGGMPKVDITINSKEQISKTEVFMNITIGYVNGDELGLEDETMDVYLVLIDHTWYLSADTPMMEW